MAKGTVDLGKDGREEAEAGTDCRLLTSSPRVKPKGYSRISMGALNSDGTASQLRLTSSTLRKQALRLA